MVLLPIPTPTSDIADLVFEKNLQGLKIPQIQKLHRQALREIVEYMKVLARQTEGSTKYHRTEQKMNEINRDLDLMEEKLNHRLRLEYVRRNDPSAPFVFYDFRNSLVNIIAKDQEAIRANVILLERELTREYGRSYFE